MIEQRRGSSRSAQNAPGATAVIGGLVVLLVVLAVLAFRSLSSSGESAFATLGQWFESASVDEAPATPASETAPATGDVPAAATVPAEGDDSIPGALANCLPRLQVLAQNERLLAVDASASNVDVVQEWGTPGEFVRLGCSWDGSETTVHEAGRMFVPPMVGALPDMPAKPLDLATLTPEWFSARMRAAAAIGGLVEVTRIEVSWVGEAGVLVRVRVLHNGVARDVVLDSSDRVMPEGTRFPQVQRMTETSSEAAQLGYSDMRSVNWSVGVLDSLEQMRDVHFARGQRLQSLQFSRVAVVAMMPGARAGGPRVRVVIDHYGQRQESEDRGEFPHACAKPFTFAEARAALDTALRARRQTVAEFEEIDFEMATLDCAQAGQRPAWHFTGG